MSSLRATVKKELNAIEAANKQLKESIAEQEQVYLKQKEQMEKAKITLSKMQAEQQAKVQKMEIDFLQAKMKKSIDDIYSNEVSVHDKAHEAHNYNFDGKEDPVRGLSGKSNSKSLSIKRGQDENKFVTINFDGRQKGPINKNSHLDGSDSTPMDKNQLMNQVKNYDMDDQTKAFLENYLLDEAKPKDLLMEKEVLPTGLSDDRVGEPQKDQSRDSEAKKVSPQGKELPPTAKDQLPTKGLVSEG